MPSKRLAACQHSAWLRWKPRLKRLGGQQQRSEPHTHGYSADWGHPPAAPDITAARSFTEACPPAAAESMARRACARARELSAQQALQCERHPSAVPRPGLKSVRGFTTPHTVHRLRLLSSRTTGAL